MVGRALGFKSILTPLIGILSSPGLPALSKLSSVKEKGGLLILPGISTFTRLLLMLLELLSLENSLLALSVSILLMLFLFYF
jgi:hypothetical protein